MKRWQLVVILLWTISVCGCDDKTSTNAPSANGNTPSTAQWVKSSDGQLSLRLLVKPTSAKSDEVAEVVAQLRNETQVPLAILRPFGDRYAARAEGIKIWDKEKRIVYTGVTMSYTLGEGSFVVMGPGEVVEDAMLLSTSDFDGLQNRRDYVSRYDYSYDGHSDAQSLMGKSKIWRGVIVSREVSLKTP